VTHRFRPGQSVRLIGAGSRNAPGGLYQVVRRLPYGDGDLQYCIKSSREQHDRVVKERDLERA
jgi:hypothetical protein